jgi:hypothetical protein
MVNYYPQEYDHGCSKTFYIECLFEYLDNSLIQISEDFHVKGLSYSEPEIWYFVKQSLSFMEAYFQRVGQKPS